ncbi:MAG: histidine phosphatase family protein [Bacteroidia bacterium]
MITILLIRHAESEGNINHHLIGGQSNHFPLTERGRQQARLLGERLQREGLRFDACYASTALRAIDTAVIISGYVGFPVDAIQQRAHLLELSQGDWTGLPRIEIYTPERMAEARRDSLDFKAPGGESPREVADRMERWLLDTLAPLDPHTDQTIAAVSHGFAIKTLVARLLGSRPDMTRDIITHNTSLTAFQYDGQHWYLERVNDYAHIAGTDIIGHY